jgi:hypothetical protein
LISFVCSTSLYIMIEQCEWTLALVVCAAHTIVCVITAYRLKTLSLKTIVVFVVVVWAEKNKYDGKICLILYYYYYFYYYYIYYLY